MMNPGISSYVSQSNMSSSSYQETEKTLQEQEVLAPPPMFADMSELNDICNRKMSLFPLTCKPSNCRFVQNLQRLLFLNNW
jgi:hypothetical protein